MKPSDPARAAAAHFESLVLWLREARRAGEEFTLRYSAESSDFIRFNHARVRQAGHVQQASATLELFRGERHASHSLTLRGEREDDQRGLALALHRLRDLLEQVPADPFTLFNRQDWRSESTALAASPDAEEVIAQVAAAARGSDLVGFYANGPLFRGFANSCGAFGWHAASNCNFEWSLFDASAQAVKSSLAGPAWDAEAFVARMAAARQQLQYLSRPLRQLSPGKYRTYLAPAALEELFAYIGYGGFSTRGFRTKQSILQQLASGQAALSPLIDLEERISGSPSPAFTGEGYLREDIKLVEGGRLVGQLTGSRSAVEYGLPCTGSNPSETPEALVMGAGMLPSGEILERLGSGLYIGNLWYVNQSDVAAARLTGLTRFASFWVENGQIQAPIAIMRFDDSLYDFLGEHLSALTEQRELIASSNTYGERHTASMRLPGALTERFTFTL